MTVFSGELLWFVGSLVAAAAAAVGGGGPGRFGVPGYYPLGGNLSGSGGLHWFVGVPAGGGERSLVLRRYATKFRPFGEQHDAAAGAPAREPSVYTRYLRFYQAGKYPAQVAVPASIVKGPTFAAFTEGCAAALAAAAERAVADLARANPMSEAPPVASAFVRLVWRGRLNGADRRMLLEPGLPPGDGGPADVLPEDVTSLLLKACGGGSSAAALSAALKHVVDPRCVRTQMSWARRYDPAVLRGGWLLGVDGGDEGELFTAVRDPGLFAADPLLTSLGTGDPAALAGLEPGSAGADEGEWAQPPQIKPSALGRAYARAANEGWTDRSVVTAAGVAPVPAADRAAVTRQVAAPAPGLRLHRWKVLQLADLCSAAACCVPAGLDGDRVLSLQRVALLVHDAGRLFPPADRTPDVAAVIDRSAARYAALLRGDPGPAVAALPSQLPAG